MKTNKHFFGIILLRKICRKEKTIKGTDICSSNGKIKFTIVLEKSGQCCYFLVVKNWESGRDTMNIQLSHD